MSTVVENLARIRQRMEAAARRAGRDPESVRLVAVTKRVEVARILEAVEAGQRLFGENFVQEAEEKIAKLPPELTWHFIGHLQSNKVRQVAEHFQVMETIDRPKLADALEKQLARLGRRMAVLVQVNIGREPQKGGVLPEEAEGLLRYLASLKHLEARGLMAMPPYFEDQERVRPYFRQLRQLSEAHQAKGLLGGHGPVELSMGMSGDFEAAIEEGATLVRVGTALFGARG